ncbi:hypothetical protein OHD33_28235 [Escherichia coli]|nr:hypothetical protein [Escherichia coli]
MKTNAPRLFFVDKEAGVSFDVFHVLSVSFPVTACATHDGECNLRYLTENVPFAGTGGQSCMQDLYHSSDERKTYVAVKKPALLPALVIAVK